MKANTPDIEVIDVSVPNRTIELKGQGTVVKFIALEEKDKLIIELVSPYPSKPLFQKFLNRAYGIYYTRIKKQL